MTDTLPTHAIDPHIEALTTAWLDRVVIGQKLCPFASKPRREGQIRIAVCPAETEGDVLEALHAEFSRLDTTPAAEVDTTVLVLPYALASFEDYNQFLDLVDDLMDEFDWTGTYQVATFHPDYCFAGAQPDDAENLTNRAPYPILHLLREASMGAALAGYLNPAQIPTRNIAAMQALSDAQKRELFPYLYPAI